MNERRGSWAWLLALAAVLVACAPEKELEVEYSRCRTVHYPGPVCAPWTSGVNLWLPIDPGTQVEIRAGGCLLAAESVEEIQGGRLYRKVATQAHASRLTVSLRLPDGRSGPRWSLALAAPEIPAWQAEIDDLRKSGRMAEVRRRLLQLQKSAPRREQGAVLKGFAELARLEGDNAGRESYLQQGIAADRTEGYLSDEVEKMTALAGLYTDQGRFRKARQTLSAVELPLNAPVETKFQLAFYQGLLADRVGDYRSALAKFREATSLVKKVRGIHLQWQAEQILANLLQDLGLSQEETFVRLRADFPGDYLPPCDLGDLLTNWAWARFLAREVDAGGKDPTPMFEEALSLYGGACAAPEKRLNARLNLALAYLQAGQWPRAREILEQISPLASKATLDQRLWRQDLEAQLAIAEGNPALGLSLFEKLEDSAERGLSFQGRFRAALGRARAQLALGRKAEALKALATADRLIDEQAVHVPAHEGRDTLVAQWEMATRLYLKLLLDDGQRQKAFELARRARSRLLRQLSARDLLAGLDPAGQQAWIEALERYRALRNEIDREAVEEWQLADDRALRARASRAARLAKARDDLDRAVPIPATHTAESRLAPPPPGEVVLLYQPLPNGWVGFAADEHGIEINLFDLPADLTDPQLARILLEPFRPALERADRIRVLPSGRLRSVDFHALPFDGQPLLARFPVIYGLDLPPHPLRAPAGRREALLVADPQGNLRAARQEAASLAAKVSGWGPGWALARLDGPAAQAQAVREKLPGAGLFHYAGHGLFAGLGGWDSELLLAENTRLTLGDVLALRPAPDWVILSSCSVGRSSAEAPGEGVGLAHAFLLAGSRAVIAATRDVPDTTARDLMTELYRGWHPGLDLPRHFQRAQQACGRRHPAQDCASFRLLEP